MKNESYASACASAFRCSKIRIPFFIRKLKQFMSLENTNLLLNYIDLPQRIILIPVLLIVQCGRNYQNPQHTRQTRHFLSMTRYEYKTGKAQFRRCRSGALRSHTSFSSDNLFPEREYACIVEHALTGVCQPLVLCAQPPGVPDVLMPI